MADPFQDPTNFPGYVHQPVSRSQQEALQKRPFARVGDASKSAVQGYIASFLDSNGKNRRLFESIGVRFPVQYVTDYSFDPTVAGTPEEKHVQLARMFNELKQKIPCILLVDGGITPMPVGIGDWDTGFRPVKNGPILQRIAIIATVAVDIVAVAQDPGMAEQFRDILLLIFGPLRAQANGFQLVSEDSTSNTVLTAPLVTPQVSNINVANLENDNSTARFHYVSMSMEWRYESVTVTGWKATDKFSVSAVPYGGVLVPDSDNPSDVYEVLDPKTLDDAYPMAFEIPDTVRLGRTVPCPSLNERPDIEVYIDRPDRAYLEDNGRTFRAKQLGQVVITARDRMSGAIHASKRVTIVP